MDKKGFLENFTEFMGDSEGLSQEEVIAELREEGVDIDKFLHRINEILKKGDSNGKRI